MRIEISENSFDRSLAHIKSGDLVHGKFIIYLGSNVEYQEASFNTAKRDGSISYKRLLAYSHYSQRIENDIEITLTHEFIHILIWKITRKIGDVVSFDNVDDEDVISGYGLVY